MFQRISISLIATCFSFATMAQFKPQAPGTSPKPTIPIPQGKPAVQGKPIAPQAKSMQIAPQGKPPVAVQPQMLQTPQPKPINFKRINSDLEYALVVDKPTSPKAQEGDVVNLHMVSVCNNRVMYNSRAMNKNKPANFGINKSTFKADVVAAIQMMSPGDSLIAQVDASEMFKNTKNKMPDFIKAGDKIQYYIKMVSIKTKAQLQKEQQASVAKQQKEMNAKLQSQMTKQQKEQKVKQALIDAKLIGVEDAQLQTYFTKNNLTPKKTLTGMYYLITEKGEGDMPLKGDTAVMNYTGKLMDGKAFDSNMDTTFHHVSPFEFPLGQGRVIKGWDEGVALLPKGSKATFYIPSRMGYGVNAQAKIPANSILIFDVELKNIKPVPVK
jgi:FKBP-type peptidyl-prolyl cis-trans isomerase FkpA